MDGHPPTLATPGAQHRFGEVRSDDASRKPALDRQLSSDVQSPGTEVEIHACRPALPIKLANRLPSPASIDVERQQVIQQVVSGRDVRKHGTHVRAFVCPATRGVYRATFFIFSLEIHQRHGGNS
jgi:hypothetical protein